MTKLRALVNIVLRRCLSSPPHQAFAGDVGAASDVADDLCRLLSDYRASHHDLEHELLRFSAPLLSHSIVDHVLKRCIHLTDSCLRFFLWASRLPSFLPSPNTHLIIISSLASARRFHILWSLLSELRDDPSLQTQVHIQSKTFWIIFRAYSRAGLPSDALRAFKKMSSYGIQPGIEDLHKLILSLCRHKHVSLAQDFFDESKADFPVDQKSYCILMNGWVRAGEPGIAIKLFDEMLERGIRADLVTHNSVISSLCKAGRIREAYKLLRNMKSDHGLDADESTYAIFVRSACEEGNVGSAIQAFNRMRRLNLSPNVFTFNCFIRLLCENEKIEEAYEVLDKIIHVGAKPDVWCFNALMAVHCKLKEANKAMRLLSMMDKNSCPPDKHTYNMLLKMLLVVGRIDRAKDVWVGMEGRGFYPSVSSYAVMIHGLCKKKGRVKEACGYFEKMVEEGIPPYLTTCEILKSELLRHGFTEYVDILTDKMQRSTSCTIRELSKTMDRSKRADKEQEVSSS